MGGTAAIHGMMYMRGHPHDYDILEQDGIEGWSWKDVFPFFLKSEDNLDMDNPDSNIDVSKHSSITVPRLKFLDEDSTETWNQMFDFIDPYLQHLFKHIPRTILLLNFCSYSSFF